MANGKRTRLYNDFLKMLKGNPDEKGFGYGNELEEANDEAFEDFLNSGAVTDHNGKRLPGRAGRSEERRADAIGKLLESGKPFYVYRKGEQFPREVVYDFQSGSIKVSKQTVDKMKKLREPPYPDGADRIMAFFGNEKKKEMVARWDKYVQRRTVLENVRDKKRINRRRRNDTELYRSAEGAKNYSSRDAYESLMTAMKTSLGYEKDFAQKGNRALGSILNDGEILDENGRHIDLPGSGSEAEMTEALGRRIYEENRPVYIYKPGEKSPHEVYLGSDGTLVVSEKTIDKMPTEVEKPRWYHRFAHAFSGSNETVLAYERAQIRARLNRERDMPKTFDPEKAAPEKEAKKEEAPEKAVVPEKAPEVPANEAVEKAPEEAPKEPEKQPETLSDKLAANYARVNELFKAGKITQEEMFRQLNEGNKAIEEEYKKEQAEKSAPEVLQPESEKKAENNPELLNAAANADAENAPQKAVPVAETGVISDLLKTIEMMQKQMAEMQKQMNEMILGNLKAMDMTAALHDAEVKQAQEAQKEAEKAIGHDGQEKQKEAEKEVSEEKAPEEKAPEEKAPEEKEPEEKEPEVKAPEKAPHVPVIGSGSGIEYDLVNQRFVRFEREGLTPKEEALQRSIIMNGGKEPMPGDVETIEKTDESLLARVNAESQADSAEPCALVEKVVQAKGAQAVSGQMCDNIYNMHKNAMASKAALQDKCQEGGEFIGGDDVKNIVNYHNMKKDLAGGEITDGAMELYSSGACIGYTTDMMNASKNMVYASGYKHDAAFYQKHVLSDEGLEKLSGKFNKDMDKVLNVKNGEAYTESDVFQKALEGAEKIHQKQQLNKELDSLELDLRPAAKQPGTSKSSAMDKLKQNAQLQFGSYEESDGPSLVG